MKLPTPPDHPLPWLYSPYQELSDQQAAAIRDFLYELITAFENRYAGQLHRAYEAEERRL